MKYLRVLGVVMLLVTAAVQAVPVRLDFGLPYAQIERLLGRPNPASFMWFDLHVGCGEKVEAGQRIAVQRNARGRVILEYLAPKRGRVDMIAHGSQMKPGDTILEIETFESPSECIEDGCIEVASP